jgi:hypothetical protein
MPEYAVSWKREPTEHHTITVEIPEGKNIWETDYLIRAEVKKQLKK